MMAPLFYHDGNSMITSDVRNVYDGPFLYVDDKDTIILAVRVDKADSLVRSSAVKTIVMEEIFNYNVAI